MAATDSGVAQTTTQTRIEPGVGVADLYTTWRRWVAEHWLAGSLMAGVVATHLATVFGIWFHGIGLPDLNWPQTNGAVIFPDGSTVVQYVSGGVLHYIDGLIFAMLFALMVHPRVPVANTQEGNIAKAIGYSLVLATISAGFLVPYVYFPRLGAGLFSTGFGWKLVFAIYLWHLIWGFFLGLLYNPKYAEA
jgi:hypothetical protein